MADGEEKAIFVGLRDDAQKTLPDAAKHASSFADDTADRMENSLGRHAENEATQEENLTSIGKRPAQEPQDVRPTKAPKTNAAPDDVPDGDVTDAGVTSGGASSAESGATDPVDVVSGQLLETAIDFSLPGVLPLVLRRAYTSGYRHGGLLGPGWSSTLDVRLLVDERGAVKFLGDDAQCLDFGVPFGFGLGLPSYPDHGARWALARDPADGAWTVSNPLTALAYRFAAEGPVRAVLAIRDRTGNEIRVQRDEQQRPVMVEHSGGYRVRVESVETAGGPRIAGYHLESDLEGDASLLVGFGYDEAGRLTGVTDSTRAAHCYEYDEHDRIVAWIDRAGFRYPYRYDEAGRVVETGEEGGLKHALISYDSKARATSVTDGLGHTTVFHYDRYQQVTSIVDPMGAETSLHKDAYGRLLEHTTPLGHTTSFTYDHDGNRTKVTYPDGQSVSLTYHGPGLPARIDLPDGASWHYAYDVRGNAVAETDPLGAITRFAYNEHGAVVAVTDPLGATQRYEVDTTGLPVAAIDPAGARTQITRDRQGRVTQMRTPDGALTAVHRDSEGRVVAQTAPDGTVTRYGYDAAGNQTLITDPSGRVTRIDYGSFYAPIARTNPDGSRYLFDYDPELRPTRVTGPTGLTWTYSYNEAGQRIAERDFDGREQRYTFDDDGRLVEHTAADGVATTYERDAAGRLVELRAGNDGARFGYDAVGRLVSAVNGHATVSLTRDLLGRTVREEVNGQSVTRTYDAAGNLAERTSGSGQFSRWTYDVLGEAASLSTGAGTISFARDVLGREIRRDLGAVALTQSYDAAGQLATQQLTSGARVLQERTYGYDADGLPVRVSDLLRSTRVMDLDPLGRITNVHNGDQSERYTYDAIGNLTAAYIPQLPSEADATAASGEHAVTGTRTTRAGRNDYAYDERGRLVGKTRRTLSGQKLTWTYTWNDHDRLTAVTRPDGQQWSYRYDALGRRIDKTHRSADGQAAETVAFGWDGSLLVEQTTRRSAGPATSVTWDYEPGGYRPAAQRRSMDGAPAEAGAQQFADADQERTDAEFWAIVTDLTGTPQELVTQDGRIAWAEQTPLWGARPDLGAAEADRIDCPLGFPGQYHDPETGLYYNNQRYYDPDTAAYLSPDPKGLNAAPHPQRYVSNPLTAIDPLGLTPQGPTPRMKTDDELQADADSIHEGFRTAYGDRTYNARTVSTYQAEDGSLYYSVNGSKSYKGMDDFAKGLGYKRVFGKALEGPEQTDAEQIMLNGVDKKEVPNAGRIATSRPPCGELRNNGKPAQNCASRIKDYLGIKLVGRYAP
jgi:RHS repeat-associated protein